MKGLLITLLSCILSFSSSALLAQDGGGKDKKPQKEQTDKNDTCKGDSCKKPEKNK